MQDMQVKYICMCVTFALELLEKINYCLKAKSIVAPGLLHEGSAAMGPYEFSSSNDVEICDISAQRSS